MCMVASAVSRSFQHVLEEEILLTTNQGPVYMIGWEGLFSLVLTIMLLVPFAMTKCHIDDAFCSDTAHLEDLELARD